MTSKAYDDAMKQLNELARHMAEKKARELGIDPAGMSSFDLGDAILAQQHAKAVEIFKRPCRGKLRINWPPN
jgi:hypothetical protein